MVTVVIPPSVEVVSLTTVLEEELEPDPDACDEDALEDDELEDDAVVASVVVWPVEAVVDDTIALIDMMTPFWFGSGHP